MKQQQRRAHSLCLCFCLLMLGGTVGTVNGVDLAEMCGQAVQKVIPCLNFATGKAEAPTKECCDAATKIKDSDPECLCYIIQQTHKGSPESKSMGIQEDKLLQLPSACNLKNASITNCPKLLGLSSSSPDAAIFKNASSVTPPAAATETATLQRQKQDSYGSMLRPPVITDLMVVALSLVLVVIPMGLFSIYT